MLVAPGTYLENLFFGGKLITLTSQNGPEVTIIDGHMNGATVSFASGEGPQAIISGFTIQGGYGPFGSGIAIFASSPTIVSNIIQYNAQQPCEWGAGIGGDIASPIIHHNLFRNNTADNGWFAGVVSFVNDSSPIIADNIFANNPCRALNLVLPPGNNPLVINNTFVSNNIAIRPAGVGLYLNNVLLGNGVGVESPFGSAQFQAWSNNLVFGGQRYLNVADQTGTNGNISADPLFACAPSGDFHFLPDSPCIDAGNNLVSNIVATDFDGNPRILDGHNTGTPVVDMGALEFNPATPPSPCLWISCPTNFTVYGAAGQTSVVVDYPPPQVSFGATATSTPPSGSALPPGTNIIICTATSGTNTVECSFEVTVLIRPPNDDFDFPTVIPALPYTNYLDATGATSAPDDPMCAYFLRPGATVWYEFTPTQDVDFLVDSAGSDYAPELSAYIGPRGNLLQVACGFQSNRFTAYAGYTYHLVVDSTYGIPPGHLHLYAHGLPPFQVGLSTDPLGTFNPQIDTVNIGGTITSTRPCSVLLYGTIRQERGHGRAVERYFDEYIPSCPSNITWTATLWNRDSGFRGGPAQVSVVVVGYDPVAGENAFNSVSTAIFLRGSPP